jgi:hypothetical protein
LFDSPEDDGEGSVRVRAGKSYQKKIRWDVPEN